MDKRIDRARATPSTSASRVAPMGEAIPAGIAPVLRRFWRFTQEMAKRFSKQLLKNREEDFLKVVRTKFEDWRE